MSIKPRDTTRQCGMGGMNGSNGGERDLPLSDDSGRSCGNQEDDSDEVNRG